MSGYLWKYYLEGDVESFRYVLGGAAHSARPGPQKGAAGWQAGAFGAAVNSSPGAYGASPAPPSTGRRRVQAPVALARSDINSRDAVGMTILHHVASSTAETAEDFAQALLEHPLVDLYIQDAENGWTSLHRAFYFGNLVIARLILDRDTKDILGHGSRGYNQQARGLVKIKDKEGYGPLDLYSLTIKDRTLRPDLPVEYDADSEDEMAQGESGDQDEETRRRTVVPHVLLKGDEVFTFGSNKNVTLGFGDQDDRQYPERITLRRPDHLLQRFYREHLEAWARSGLSSHEARGSGCLQPKAVTDLPVHIRNTPIVLQDMQMSKLHTAVLTTDPVSNLYMCGHGPGGRLGTGSETTRYQFTCIEGGGLGQKKVAAVALGQNHTLAITDDGEIYSWGNDAFGQLGYSLPRPSVKDDDPISTYPRQIFGPLKRETIIGIAASRIHSVAHTPTSLYTFGKNEGQLGIVDSDARSLEMQTTPRKIAASLFSSPIMSVSAIEGATIALLESREVWVFANYGYARLNFDLDKFTNHFLKESWLATKYDITPNKVSKITAAGDTICALSTGGEVFTVTISRRTEGSQDASTSTTNPKQIKGALSQPHRVWSAKSSHMAARDVDIDQDGSIILATEAGSVWRRTKRATIKNATSSGIGEYKPKDYKFLRVSGLTRVIAVRASAFGAYAAVRKDCDVTRTQIVVDEPQLWNDVAPLLPFHDWFDRDEETDAEEHGSHRHAPAKLRSLRKRVLEFTDLEKVVDDIRRRIAMDSDATYDMELGSTLSDMRIPVHEFVVAGRTPILREYLADFRSREGDMDVPELLTITQEEKKTVVMFHGVDFLTVFDFVLYAYTDSIVDFWNLTRQYPALAVRYRTIRTELMKLASRLELRQLEPAVRQMVSPLRSMNFDFASALDDPSFLDSCDVIVELADGEMHVHSAIMCQRCPFFEGLFRGRAGGGWLAGRRALESSHIRIDLTHIETHLFELILQHVYTDAGEEIFDEVTSEDLNDFLALDELIDHVLDVMGVANELMLDRLTQICQRFIGKYVNARNVCSLLDAIAPSSIPEFKDAGLEYVCLSLEAVLQNGSLDELDKDLLYELNEVVRDNQLACLPFARSGRAEALLFDKYPELAERIENGKRAKVDAIVLSNKYADEGMGPSSFRAQSLDELSTSPLRQRARRKASRDTGPEESPAATPQLKGKASVPDLMFDMSEGEDEEDATKGPIKPPQFGKLPTRSAQTPVGSPDALDLGLKGKAPIGPALGSSFSTSPAVSKEPRIPGKPWGTPSLGSTKLDLKDIMSQDSSDKPSNITLGLRQQNRDGIPGPATPRLSQKERKRLQQAQQLGQTPAKSQAAAPSVSPWQATSQKKISPLPTPPVRSTSLTAEARPEESPKPSPAHLTMRQTIANDKASNKQKQSKKKDSQAIPNPAAERGMSVSTTPIPTPHSVRHIPLPAHSPTSPSLNFTIDEILSQQLAEKEYYKDAAAKRSLQEIQQEQEFQQWWDQESKRVMEEEEKQKRETERALKASRGKGRPVRGRGKGKDKEKKEEGAASQSQGKGSKEGATRPAKESETVKPGASGTPAKKNAGPKPTGTPAKEGAPHQVAPSPRKGPARASSMPKLEGQSKATLRQEPSADSASTPRHDASERGKGRNRGQRSGRGGAGGGGRGGKPSATPAPAQEPVPKDLNAAAVPFRPSAPFS